MPAFESFTRLAGQTFRKGNFTIPHRLGLPRRYFDKTMLTDFVEGKGILSIESSWLSWIGFIPGVGAQKPDGALVVGFKPDRYNPDGFVQPYAPVMGCLAATLPQADSKGKWLHKYILGRRLPDGTWEHKIPKLKGWLGEVAKSWAAPVT